MMATIAFALLVLSTMDFHYPNARIKNAFQLLDKYSYTIYLAQGIVFCGIIDKMTGVPNVISFVISVVGTFALSYLLFNYLESPLQKLLQKWFLNPSR